MSALRKIKKPEVAPFVKTLFSNDKVIALPVTLPGTAATSPSTRHRASARQAFDAADVGCRTRSSVRAIIWLLAQTWHAVARNRFFNRLHTEVGAQAIASYFPNGARSIRR